MGNNERKCYNNIDKIIKNKGCNKWKQGMENKSTLRYFKEKVKPERELFYYGSWEAKLLFKARSDSLELNGRTGEWRGIPTNCKKMWRGKRNLGTFPVGM